jgi:methionyl aminopeptidase
VTVVNTMEGTGTAFSLDKFLDVRRRTREAVHAIARQVEVGMVEEDARAMARATLSELGMRRGWHHVIVRFGPNTTKDFMEPSDKGVVLGSDDISRDAKAIWDIVRERWFTSEQTGRELYDFAVATAADHGWKLNMDLSGHRLSDFPHAAHYDGPMAEVDFRPAPKLWVLEIAIIHPTRTFGAFYEDLLLEDQSFG